MDHPLLVYLRRHGETQSAFARRARLSPSWLSDIVNGRQPPGRKATEAIAEATGGDVTADVLFGWWREQSRGIA